jgi:septal ring factor EnvC (AmiA/AmiB activator)
MRAVLEVVMLGVGTLLLSLLLFLLAPVRRWWRRKRTRAEIVQLRRKVVRERERHHDLQSRIATCAREIEQLEALILTKEQQLQYPEYEHAP